MVSESLRLEYEKAVTNYRTAVSNRSSQKEFPRGYFMQVIEQRLEEVYSAATDDQRIAMDAERDKHDVKSQRIVDRHTLNCEYTGIDIVDTMMVSDGDYAFQKYILATCGNTDTALPFNIQFRVACNPDNGITSVQELELKNDSFDINKKTNICNLVSTLIWLNENKKHRKKCLIQLISTSNSISTSIKSFKESDDILEISSTFGPRVFFVWCGNGIENELRIPLITMRISSHENVDSAILFGDMKSIFIDNLNNMGPFDAIDSIASLLNRN